MNAVEIAQELIRCPSVTPDEGGALAYLERLLIPAGFSVWRPIFSADGTPSVENLFATIGTDNGPHFVFAGHTDVVPPGPSESWSSPPFDAAIEDGRVFGRGAVDMKGGIASFAAAVLEFLDAYPGFKGRVSFLITGDEEGPAINGTVRLLSWAAEQGFKFDHCIVGEPTNPDYLGQTIKVGRRGSMSGTVTVSGIQGHVAYPHLADNPIRSAVGLIDALLEPGLDNGTDQFEPSNLEFTSIDTDNLASNITPEQIQARFNVRFNDNWTPSSLENELRNRLEKATQQNRYRRDGLDPISYKLDIKPDFSESFSTRSEELIDSLSQVIQRVTGNMPELSTGGGTSDARFIKSYCPVIEFGLVGRTMHQVDEHTTVDDLQNLSRIYFEFLKNYFTQS